MNKPPDLRDLLDHIRRAPRVIVIPAAIVGVVVLLAAVATVMHHGGSSGGHDISPPSPSTTIATADSDTGPVRQQSGRSQDAGKSSSPPAFKAKSLHVTLPGRPEPAGLAESKAHYQLAVAADDTGQSILGAQLIDAPTSSFSTLPDQALAQMVPSHGELTERWTWWLRAKRDGKHLFVLKLAGETQAAATVRLDGQRKSVADVFGYGNDPETGVGSVSLGSGWHQIEITIDHRVPRNGGGMDATASLFVRGPKGPSPVSVTPAAIDPTAQRNGAGAAPASSVHTETTPEPARGVTSAGGAG